MSIEEAAPMIEKLENVLPKNLEVIEKSIAPIVEELKNRCPTQMNMIDRIYERGWALGTDTGPTVHLLTNTVTYGDISKDAIDKIFIDIYSDKSNLLEELESISYPGNRFNDNIKIMKRLIQNDNEAWKVLLPEIFSMLDMQYVILDDDLFPDNFGYITSKLNRKTLRQKKNHIDSDVYEYIEYKNAELIVELFSGNNQKLAGKIFNRNTIQHGGYDPANYEYSEFAKLIVLLSSLTFFIEEKKKDETLQSLGN